MAWIMRIMLVSLTTLILSACEGIKNASPPQTPILLEVFRPSNNEASPSAKGCYLALPARSVGLRIQMPWPAGVEVSLDGQILEQVPSDSISKMQALEDNDLGYYSYDVDLESEPTMWTFIVSPRPSQRRSGGFRLQLVMISLNENYQGDQKRSDALIIPIREDSGVVATEFVGYYLVEIPGPTDKIFTRENFKEPINVTFVVEGNILRLDSLPNIVVEQPEISNTTTVKLIGGSIGTFEWPSGVVTMPIDLRFEHSLVGASPSDVHFDLTTGTAEWPDWIKDTGQPLDWAKGTIGLVSVSQFKGGYLDKKPVRIYLHGRFLTRPLPDCY